MYVYRTRGSALMLGSCKKCEAGRYELKNTREVSWCDMITSSYRYLNGGKQGLQLVLWVACFDVASYTTIALTKQE